MAVFGAMLPYVAQGVALWFAVGIVYFALVGRKKLVLSPEEAFAISGGKTRTRPTDPASNVRSM